MNKKIFLGVIFLFATVTTEAMNNPAEKKERSFAAAFRFLFSKPRAQRFEAYVITLEDEQSRRAGYQKINSK